MNRVKLLMSVWALLAAAGAAAANEPPRRPVAEWFEITQLAQREQCSMYTRAHEMAAKRNDKSAMVRARASMGMACDCMPGAVSARAGALSEAERGQRLSTEEFKAMLTPILNVCAASQIREQMSVFCLEDPASAPGVANREGYCACISGRLRDLDDETIVRASIDAHRKFRERVKAAQEGRPMPPWPDSMLDEIDRGCRAELK